MRSNQPKYKDQQGLVSIIVTMIIMFILTLIVLGFAQLSRREARQSLDRQLAQQANYAAEAGVNDAFRAIKSGFTTDKNTCGPDSSIPALAKNQLNASGSVQYSCLLIKQSSNTLEFGNIDTEKSSVLPMNNKSSGTPLGTIIVSWQRNAAPATNNYPGAGGNFPSYSGWATNNNAGILRLDLIPTNGSLKRNDLISNSGAAFLYPSGRGSPGIVNTPFAAGDGSGIIASAKCNSSNGPYTCRASISGLNSDKYYLRLKSIYMPNKVSICMADSTGLACDTTKEFSGGQIVIDSTGKAQDVVKRINTRILNPNVTKGNDYPENVFQALDGFCKKFDVWRGGFNNSTPGC